MNMILLRDVHATLPLTITFVHGIAQGKLSASKTGRKSDVNLTMLFPVSLNRASEILELIAGLCTGGGSYSGPWMHGPTLMVSGIGASCKVEPVVESEAELKDVAHAVWGTKTETNNNKVPAPL